MSRSRDPLLVLAAAVFIASLATRTIWWSHAYFHPDESTALWMALDAVRHPVLPDHGLVSHYQAFQPPGLVWITAPFVAIGGGRPEVVIVGFGVLNAAAIAFLAHTVARAWGVVQAVVMSAFLTVGPDAPMSMWIWHPSLFTGTVSLLIAAGIRLRSGSRWWAGVIVAIPGLYALIHYSGFVLFASAVVLLLMSRRRRTDLAVPILAGLALTLVAWVPFLVFEAHRDWEDFRLILHGSDTQHTLLGKLHERLHATTFAVKHLGRGVYSRVHLTPLILAGAIGSVLLAARRRFADVTMVLPGLVLAAGLAAQIATNQGRRTDVLMLWLPPLYIMCGSAVAQLCDLASAHLKAFSARALRVSIASAAVAAVVLAGGLDLHRFIDGSPQLTLGHALGVARAGGPVGFTLNSADGLYLACDPPYGWGSQIWYLEEVEHPGEGIRAATRAHAFANRHGGCTTRR